MLVTKYWTDSSLIRWRIPRESGRTGYTRPTLTAWTSLQVGFTSKDNDYSLSYFKYNFHNVFRPSIHRVLFWGSEFLSPSSFPSPPLPHHFHNLLRKAANSCSFCFFKKKFSLFFFLLIQWRFLNLSRFSENLCWYWFEVIFLTSYRVPDLNYDWKTNSGRLYNYYTYGAACSEVEIDCLTGDHQVSDVLLAPLSEVFTNYIM